LTQRGKFQGEPNEDNLMGAFRNDPEGGNEKAVGRFFRNKGRLFLLDGQNRRGAG
jgi:hypothetical protein